MGTYTNGLISGCVHDHRGFSYDSGCHAHTRTGQSHQGGIGPFFQQNNPLLVDTRAQFAFV